MGDRIRITKTADPYTSVIIDTGLVIPNTFYKIEIEIIDIFSGVNARAFFAATNGGAEQLIGNSYYNVSGLRTFRPRVSGNGNGRIRFNFAPARSASPGLAVEAIGLKYLKQFLRNKLQDITQDK